MSHDIPFEDDRESAARILAATYNADERRSAMDNLHNARAVILAKPHLTACILDTAREVLNERF